MTDMSRVDLEGMESELNGKLKFKEELLLSKLTIELFVYIKSKEKLFISVPSWSILNKILDFASPSSIL